MWTRCGKPPWMLLQGVSTGNCGAAVWVSCGNIRCGRCWALPCALRWVLLQAPVGRFCDSLRRWCCEAFWGAVTAAAVGRGWWMLPQVLLWGYCCSGCLWRHSRRHCGFTVQVAAAWQQHNAAVGRLSSICFDALQQSRLSGAIAGSEFTVVVVRFLSKPCGCCGRRHCDCVHVASLRSIFF